MKTEAGEATPIQEGLLTRAVHGTWERLLIPLVGDPLVRQRLKLLWFGWPYLRLLGLRPFSLLRRLRLIGQVLRVDWSILHGHSPAEMVCIFRELCARRGEPGEAFVEAGCWQGGSSVKFSILCEELGYELHIYDSFEGVGDLSEEDRAREWDYEGQYAAPENVLRENLARLGRPAVCSIYKGWFSETLQAGQAPERIRIAYIDCDIAKGTRDALEGVVPHLVPDGVVFSQDFHIQPIRDLLADAALWKELGVEAPRVEALQRRLARIRFS